MTRGTWKCVACGYEKTCKIFEALHTCPECGTEYDVEYLSGVHFSHRVAVHKLKNSNKTTTVNPYAFAMHSNPDEENVSKWIKALKIHKL